MRSRLLVTGLAVTAAAAIAAPASAAVPAAPTIVSAPTGTLAWNDTATFVVQVPAGAQLQCFTTGSTFVPSAIADDPGCARGPEAPTGGTRTITLPATPAGADVAAFSAIDPTTDELSPVVTTSWTTTGFPAGATPPAPVAFSIQPVSGRYGGGTTVAGPLDILGTGLSLGVCGAGCTSPLYAVAVGAWPAAVGLHPQARLGFGPWQEIPADSGWALPAQSVWARLPLGAWFLSARSVGADPAVGGPERQQLLLSLAPPGPASFPATPAASSRTRGAGTASTPAGTRLTGSGGRVLTLTLGRASAGGRRGTLTAQRLGGRSGPRSQRIALRVGTDGAVSGGGRLRLARGARYRLQLRIDGVGRPLTTTTRIP